MLRICISGYTDSGKTTIGNMLSKQLNILHGTKYITETYKKFKAEADGKSEEEEFKQTSNDYNAEAFDKEIVKLAEDNNIVVTTWLGPWMVSNPTLRIWLNAPFEERVKRCSLERKLTEKEAEEYVRKKDEINIKTFKQIYNIDISDHSGFDLEINSGKFSKEEIVAMVSVIALSKENIVFR